MIAVVAIASENGVFAVPIVADIVVELCGSARAVLFQLRRIRYGCVYGLARVIQRRARLKQATKSIFRFAGLYRQADVFGPPSPFRKFLPKDGQAVPTLLPCGPRLFFWHS